MWLSVNFKLEAKLFFTRFLNWQKGPTELLQSYNNAFPWLFCFALGF